MVHLWTSFMVGTRPPIPRVRKFVASACFGNASNWGNNLKHFKALVPRRYVIKKDSYTKSRREAGYGRVRCCAAPCRSCARVIRLIPWKSLPIMIIRNVCRYQTGTKNRTKAFSIYGMRQRISVECRQTCGSLKSLCRPLKVAPNVPPDVRRMTITPESTPKLQDNDVGLSSSKTTPFP